MMHYIRWSLPGMCATDFQGTVADRSTTLGKAGSALKLYGVLICEQRCCTGLALHATYMIMFQAQLPQQLAMPIKALLKH